MPNPKARVLTRAELKRAAKATHTMTLVDIAIKFNVGKDALVKQLNESGIEYNTKKGGQKRVSDVHPDSMGASQLLRRAWV